VQLTATFELFFHCTGSFAGLGHTSPDQALAAKEQSDAHSNAACSGDGVERWDRDQPIAEVPSPPTSDAERHEHEQLRLESRVEESKLTGGDDSTPGAKAPDALHNREHPGESKLTGGDDSTPGAKAPDALHNREHPGLGSHCDGNLADEAAASAIEVELESSAADEGILFLLSSR